MDDVGLRLVLVAVERLDVGAVSSHTDKRNLPRRRTALGTSDCADEVHTSTTATRLVINRLPAEQPLDRHRGTARHIPRAHAGIHRVVILRVEVEPIAPTGLALYACPLPELLMVLVRRHAHLTIPEDNHALLLARFDLRVSVKSCGAVAVGHLDVVVVIVQRERALEQRLQPILPHPNTCPPNLLPSIPLFHGSNPLEDLVLQPVDRLLAVHTAISSKMCNHTAINKDIMVRLKAEADALLADIEGEIEG